jgi:membrane protein implicated in regulation of membrane protease activity
MAWMWLLVAAVGAVADLASGALAGVWIAAAAALALLGGWLGLPMALQVALFALAAAVLLWLVRPLVLRSQARPLHRPEMLVGKLGTVVDPVDETIASGRVAVEGVHYVARCLPGAGPLPVGAAVRVRQVDGGEVLVERL